MCVSLRSHLRILVTMCHNIRLSLLLLSLGLTSAVPDPSLAESLEALTQTCDQSQHYVGILNAVHSSLDLQVGISVPNDLNTDCSN